MSAVPLTPVRRESLAEAFAEGYTKSPDGPAVSEPGRELSYRELDTLICRLTEALFRLGARRGERVAVWLPKSVEAVAVMQAALRIGAVYVPLDPLSPPRRITALLEDFRPRVCVALESRLERDLDGELAGELSLLVLSGLGGDWRLIPSRIAGGGAVDEPSSLAHSVIEGRPGAGEELAYILYTSGSTGTPKGVCISHRNALAFIEWAHAELTPSIVDRFANHAPLHFDLSVLDVYVAFMAGACLCLIPETISFIPAHLVEFVHDQRITVWYSVPAALMLMARAGFLERPPACLRAVLFAGEPFPVAALRSLRRAMPEVRLLNLYGPTETNVCTFHEVGAIEDDAERPVPIGRACSGDSVWIVDEEDRRLPVGGRGELLVSGPTVMLGYWGSPPHEGSYRTGDIAERISSDSYQYLSRRDAMVKVRGHRVELGEVEATISRHEEVLEVAVAVVGMGEESRLVAAIVPRAAAMPGLLEIKRWCAGFLPRHMIVHEVQLLEELPRNGNGKLDRARLLAQLLGVGAHT